jgi:hypothetical protein
VPTFYGNQLFPLDNPWNQVISAAPVATNSDAIIARIVNRHSGTAPRLHADFGNPVTDGALYGIPVTVVDGTVPKVNVVIPSFGYPDESDLVQVPIPANAVIEGDGPTGPNPPSQRGDSHLLVYDRTANVLYELYQAVRPTETSFPYGGTHPTGQWGAYQISFWDLNTNSFRTIGATSADAAGLPILPGLVRPDETLPASAGGQGAINHAIRMTVQQTASLFVYPASHEASSLVGSDLPRMGERFRLKAGFVIPSTWSAEAKAIAQAMKDYGMIVADNGSDMFFTGAPSTQWNMASVLQVQSIRATDFEVVDLTPGVTGLSVTSGSTGGGMSVTITGRNFSGAAGQLHVLFGSTEATSVTILSDSQVVVVAPAHIAGTVDVRVQSGTTRTDINGASVFFGYGTSAASVADQFTFTSTSPPPPPPPPPPPANTPPTISDVTDRLVVSGQSTGDVPFTVGDAETAAGSLSVSAASSNPALVPAGSIVLGGSGANRTVSVTPTAGQSGTATITLTVTDGGGLTAGDTFLLTVTVPPPPPPAGTGDGLRATYFNNVNFTGTTVTRVDPTVSFNWGNSAPADGIGKDTFSVRWTGQVQAIETGTYTFRTYSDEGVRVWVNGQLIIDNWTIHSATYNTGTIALVAGQRYDIRVEYFEGNGKAVMQLQWMRPGQTAFAVIPKSQLYSGV